MPDKCPLSNGEILPAPVSDDNMQTDHIQADERQFLREALFQLRNSFEWSDLDQDLWQTWSTSILQWFKSPRINLDANELRTFRNIVHAIATESSLSSLLKAPGPVLTIVCLLRVVGYFSQDVREIRVEELPSAVISGVMSLAALPDTELRTYERMIGTSWKPTFVEVLTMARTLRGAGNPQLASRLVRELLVDPYHEEPRVQEALSIGIELLDYDPEAFPADVLTSLLDGSPSVQRKLVQRVFASKDVHTAITFTRWLLSGEKNRTCSLEMVGKACALIAGSEGTADAEAIGLVARLIGTSEGAEGVVVEGHVGGSRLEAQLGASEVVEVVMSAGEAVQHDDTAQADPLPTGSKIHQEESNKTDGGSGEQTAVVMFESECMADDDTEIQGFFISEEEEEDETVQPAEKLTKPFIRTVLERRVIPSGSRRGQRLGEVSLTTYTNNLSQIPTDFFPFDPDSTLDWLEATKVPSSAGKFINQIDVFLQCFTDLAEQEKYFGSVKQFLYAKSVFRDQKRCVNEQEMRSRPDQQAMWRAKDEAMKVPLETLEINYEEKVKSAVRKMVGGEIPVDRFRLQDYFIIELYQERPPTRSKEWWLLQYNPEIITDETNYVSGDRLIIQTDKVSDSMGTYVYELTDVMKDTLRLLIQEHQRAGIESGSVFQKKDGSAMSRSGFRKATYRAFAWLVGKGLGCRILRKIVLSGKTERGELRWPEQRREFLRQSRVSGDTAERHYIIRVSTPQEESGKGKGKARLDGSGAEVAKGIPEDREQEEDREPISKLGSSKSTMGGKRRTGGETAKRPQPDSEDDEVGSVASSSSSSGTNRSSKKARVAGKRDELDEWGSPGSTRADWSDERLQKWYRKHLNSYTRVRGGKEIFDWTKMASKMNEKFGTAYQGRQLKQYKENLIKQGKW